MIALASVSASCLFLSATDCRSDRPTCEFPRGERGDFAESSEVDDTALVVVAVLVDVLVLVVLVANNVLVSVGVADEYDLLLGELCVNSDCDAPRFRVSCAVVFVDSKSMRAVAPLPDHGTFGNGEVLFSGSDLNGEEGW
jgi:hypothetical protein